MSFAVAAARRYRGAAKLPRALRPPALPRRRGAPS